MKIILFLLFFAATAIASEPIVITLPHGTDLIVVQSDEEIPKNADHSFIIKSKHDDIVIHIKGLPRDDKETDE